MYKFKLFQNESIAEMYTRDSRTYLVGKEFYDVDL